ncbi:MULTISPECIES: histone deacetylase family protein [unclassified Mesorhizobium]|uniref:histone deacetylase family protein n=1 Tax=unclassified Mesorhizobium TaxID=325217 RepID=UPI000FDBA04C|nr:MULTISPECIES: histone deacetylase family protein [unclassified Mesorhizobium]TGR58320.1 histone deacetylase family protein [bacterium M00.F.Ca.ET.199.01.1.1]TGU41571.1 histone deacetylase family protein [bacterium M00.F.Ca.ET.156.01.1.1]TGV89805.1 histone deacetylase family protein [Mesorhizobium sp. M00.F.Ca.ET.149.01.1.1]TGR33063.1 histone deacetylase family protein [Mesorhizobium sp. M8A.F.Ca.ET.197.01.1.1]TGR34709.1 histone deacetylase family protein [Mesorhizobium sp. M8A.F.Ca.ET.202.0
MKAFYAQEQKRHDPKAFLSSGAAQPNPEKPERVERLLAGARSAGCTIERPGNHGLGPVSAVHTPEYLDFLEHIFERWQRIDGASAEVIPNIHPIARNGSYPASAVGQAGYHMADTACPISGETWQSALWSAWSAVEAAETVMAGASGAYALCRPPGHHAFADVAGGFCFINNSAVAAQVLRRQAARVAILDVDLHHGNGTQGIFYARSDVLTVSLHADPVRFYPFFWGHADERGEGPGLGYNFNLPLPRKSADAAFLEALGVAFQRIRAFSPDVLVVALGLDAFEGDPFGGLSVTTPGFSRIGEAIAGLDLPTVIVQEGGYLCDELGDNLTAFLTGFGGKAR